MGHEQVVVAVGVEVAGIDAHAALDPAIVIERRTRQQRAVAEGPVLLIDPQLVRLAIVGDIDVHPPVPVDIRGHDPERRTKVAGHPCLGRNVDERPVPTVAIQPVRNRREGCRSAVVPFPAACEALGLPCVDAVVEVVADIQVKPAIAVDVDERRRHAPPGVSRARRPGDIGEGPVAVVAKQLVWPEAGAIQVDPAVIVDVTRCDAHTIRARARVQAALRGDVREAQGAGSVRVHLEIVPIQTIRRRRSLERAGGAVRAEQPALHEIDVEVAIVVEVEHRRARIQDLAHVELGLTSR